MMTNTKIASVAIAAVAALTASAASAKVYTVTFTNGLASVFSDVNPGHVLGATNKNLSAFADTFVFTIPQKALVSAVVTSFGKNANFNNVNFGPLDAVTTGNFRAPAIADSVTYGLASGGTRTILTGNHNVDLEDLQFTDVLLNPGTYSISAPGVSQRSGQYSVNISFNVVPEPAVWAMMILGFGVVGSSLRARRRKVAFAA